MSDYEPNKTYPTNVDALKHLNERMGTELSTGWFYVQQSRGKISRQPTQAELDNFALEFMRRGLHLVRR